MSKRRQASYNLSSSQPATTATGLSKDAIAERGELVKERYAQRDENLDAANDIYDEVGVSKAKDAEIYYVHLPEGRNAADLIADLQASLTIRVTVPSDGEKVSEKKRADEVEAFLNAWITHIQQQEDVRFTHELTYDAIKTGVVAVRTVFLSERVKGGKYDGKFPVVMEVRDWRNIYPVFQRSRVMEVFECYETNAFDLRLDNPGMEVPDTWQNDQRVTVWEWWSEKKKAFWISGPAYSDRAGLQQSGRIWLQAPVDHRYGCLPYSLRAIRPQSKHRGKPDKMSPSLLESWAGIVNGMNIVESAKFTAGMSYINSAWVMKSPREAPELDTSTGAVNYLLPDEDVAPLTKGQVPVDLLQMGDDWASRFQRASIPTALYGENVGANMAGYAIQLLSDSGRRIITPITEAIQLAISDGCAHMLSICENLLGPMLNDQDITVDATEMIEDGNRQRAIRRGVKLDWDSLDGGYYNTVRLGDPLPQDKERGINMALGLRTKDDSGMPLMSDETIRTDILGIGDNQKELLRILQERFLGSLANVQLQDILNEVDQENAPPEQDPMQQVMMALQEMSQRMDAIEKEHAQAMGGGNGAVPPGMPPGMTPGMPPGMPPMPPEMMAAMTGPPVGPGMENAPMPPMPPMSPDMAQEPMPAEEPMAPQEDIPMIIPTRLTG